MASTNGPARRGGRSRPWALPAALATALASAIGLAAMPPDYTPPDLPPPTSLEDFVAGRLARSRAEGARAGTEERWARRGERDLALLYVHGFVASRAEGELVVDRVAARLGADAVYLRLPGHGTTAEDLASRRFTDWADEAHAVLRAVAGHYRRVIVVGTSLGGLLATHLAATRPEDVDALILASPFFGFRRRLAEVIGWPGGLWLAERVEGPERRVPLDPDDPEDHRIPGFERFWYTRYPLSAVRRLARARRALARDDAFARVRAPVLLLWYPRDVAADPAAMKRAMSRFGGSLRRSVAIDPGDHVLTSRWVRADHAAVEAAMVSFLEDAGFAR